MVDELERVRKEALLSKLRCCPGICLKRLRKATKILAWIAGVPVEV
jgi:hypothetical protein